MGFFKSKPKHEGHETHQIKSATPFLFNPACFQHKRIVSQVGMALKQYTREVPRTIVHQTIELPVDWYEFTTHLESRLGRFDASALAAARTLPDLEAAVNKMRGAEPFSIYAMYDHGDLSTIAGQPRRAKQYVLGNSRVATTMTVHDIRAAQSAPISNLIHETRPGYTTIEFESAASMFTALTDGNEEVARIAVQIDGLRAGVFQKVFEEITAGKIDARE